ncbi:MAG TPA: hypothetical protein VJZ00_17655 [Thermoanaerobaculia bacterium]|nr:hypothetical protein [Thermoanaerobaculia bacterium]
MAVILWFPLLGLAVSRLTGRMNLFLAGAGMNGLALFLAGVLHIPLIPTLIALALGALVVIVRSSRARAEGRVRAADAVLAISAIFLLATSAITPLNDFDGRAFWLLKAKAIAHEQRVDGPFFKGETAFSPRNEYPLLLPIDAATMMIGARDLDEKQVRWLYVMFAVALALEVRRRAGPWYGALVLWLPRIVVGGDGSAVSAYADIALGAFVACALFELASDDADPLRCGLWLSFLALTKNEGLPFALVLLALSAIVFRKRVLVAAAPVIAAVAALMVWRDRIQPTDDNRYFFAQIPQHLDRIGDVIVTFARHALAFADWGVFWLAVAIAAAFLAWRRQWRPLLLGTAAIVPMLAIYFVMYLASDWITRDLVNSTAPRLLTHFIGPGMYLVAYANQQLDRRNA